MQLPSAEYENQIQRRIEDYAPTTISAFGYFCDRKMPAGTPALLEAF